MLKQNETVTLWSYCNTAKKYILWVCLRVHVWIYRFTSRWYFLSVWENQSLLNVNYLSGQMGLIFICDIFFFFSVVVLHVVLSWADHAVNLDKKKTTEPKKTKHSDGIAFPPCRRDSLFPWFTVFQDALLHQNTFRCDWLMTTTSLASLPALAILAED